MPTLQELDGEQIDDIVRQAVRKRVPIVASISMEGRWINLRSRFVGVRDERVLVELPVPDEGPGYEFTPAEKIGLNFKLKHHKYICTATVACVEQFRQDDGSEISVLSVCWPVRMSRLQRRAYLRVDIPANRIVRVSFWLGGKDAEPAGGSPTAPVWSGTATNISAGGLQIKSAAEPANVIEAGDVVGMRLMFALGSETVYTDAQFRHIEEIDGGFLLGFQFLGLGQTHEGQQALKQIIAKVGGFQSAAHRRPVRQR